jgi:UDP-N-acetylglucosamine diphosphorylase/glucosamine-1-phosphate N-acetyltransferase
MDDRKGVAMRVCLFEDQRVTDLEPLTLTRPAFDLLCGQTTLAAKQYRYFGASQRGSLVRPHLADLCRQPPTPGAVNDLAWLRAAPVVLVNGRWLPTGPGPVAVHPSPGPHVGLVGDEVAYAVVQPEHLADCAPNTLDDCLATWKASLPHRPAGGTLFRHLWEVVDHNGEQILRDWHDQGSPAPFVSGVDIAVVGPREQLAVDPSARVDPMVVADTTRGPVVLDRKVVVSAFTRLEGPCYVGPGTHLLGAKVRSGTSLGPQCRIGGEVEASIVLGYANKYHDGFLGHAYVGEWVNLGAGTHNSDLRNDYAEVTVFVNGRRVPTGRTKVGCYLGDHVKTGLGTLLNTGTTAGVFCNLLPGGLLPRHIPSFCSWWNGTLVENSEVRQLLHTAGEVLRRRGRALTEAHAVLYRTLCEQTAAQRRLALREAEQRRLRRSA